MAVFPQTGATIEGMSDDKAEVPPSSEPLRVDEKELDSDFGGYQRLWQDKPFTGIALELYPDTGEIYGEQEYKDGIEHGYAREWHTYPSQLKHEAFYQQGRLEGYVREWYSDGQLKAETRYAKGAQLDKKEWDEHGQPRTGGA